MARLRVFVMLVAVCLSATSFEALAQGKFDSSSGSLYGVALTTSQTAVFAAFLADSGALPGAPGGIQSVLTVSNVLATPPGMTSDFINLGGGDLAGRVEFYLFGQDGRTFSGQTSADMAPGQTITVRVRDILDVSGVPSDEAFIGYGWVIANFDAVAGTYSVLIEGVNFTQAFELLPGVGQGQTPTAGLPLLPR